MSTALEDLRPGTLVRDAEGQVLSARHRVFVMADEDFSQLARCETQLREEIASGELEIVDAELPTVPTCLGCGCSEEFACPGGCSWVGDNACSNCAGSGKIPRCRAVVEKELASIASVGSTENLAPVVGILLIQCELLLDIREALQLSAIKQDSMIMSALHSSAEAQSRIVTPGGGLLR